MVLVLHQCRNVFSFCVSMNMMDFHVEKYCEVGVLFLLI